MTDTTPEPHSEPPRPDVETNPEDGTPDEEPAEEEA
jgi:hypothetical protein